MFFFCVEYIVVVVVVGEIYGVEFGKCVLFDCLFVGFEEVMFLMVVYVCFIGL